MVEEVRSSTSNPSSCKEFDTIVPVVPVGMNKSYEITLEGENVLSEERDHIAKFCSITSNRQHRTH